MKTTSNVSSERTMPGITLFVHRYDPNNLYHAQLDWWNVYQMMQQVGLEDPAAANQKYRIIFLDKHGRKTMYDQVWKDLFGAANIIFWRNQLRQVTSFEHAYFVPPSYSNPIAANVHHSLQPYCPQPGQMQEFVNFALQRYKLQNTKQLLGRVVILRHPAKSSDDPWEALRGELMMHRGSFLSSVQVVDANPLSFREQLELIREAHVMIVDHGVEMSQLIWMHEEDGAEEESASDVAAAIPSHLVELSPTSHTTAQDVYQDLLAWKPHVQHHWLPILSDPSGLTLDKVDEVTSLVTKLVETDAERGVWKKMGAKSLQ
eukprot:CAMPEP_0198126100 /NCGR_PEP_ID=MMETSP1442-20131203/44051_1 /TAXON_ID= /ORGANISM="Craspedostauros australis, Strain CCMP3328" /LENGTH=316 /DNA_ID=CAMNT_0043785819 /DNA_START=96 /DNA_END=1046 /DNA_ORIENTATION=+